MNANLRQSQREACIYRRAFLALAISMIWKHWWLQVISFSLTMMIHWWNDKFEP